MSQPKLLKCGLCSHPVSSTAKKCTSCGVKFQKKTSLTTWIFSLIFMLIVFGVLFNTINNKTKNQGVSHEPKTLTTSYTEVGDDKAKERVIKLCHEKLQSYFDYSEPNQVSFRDSKVIFTKTRILALVKYANNTTSNSGFCKFSPQYEVRMLSYAESLVKFD